MVTIDSAVLDGTEHINRREDLDNLQPGQAITVYDGHNYGELMSKRQKLTYLGKSGETVIFSNENLSAPREVRLSGKGIVSREGVVVLSKQNGEYKF